MKETKIYADEFCTTFASTTEMLEFLAERAKQSKWIRKPTRMLKLVPLEKEAETIEEACEKELEGIVEDTEKNTQLVLKVKHRILSASFLLHIYANSQEPHRFRTGFSQISSV